MRRHLLLVSILSGLSGCYHHHAAPGAVSGAVLGRVVIYRNGVAFYERRAMVEDGHLSIHVPREAVDDFLKSLTVSDPSTHEQLSVSIPRKESTDGSSLTLTLESADKHRSEVLLTYVTEAPAWKPSYRVVVGPNGKVMLEAWAIVDNVSSEDWNRVLVGVGASSAMSFRYDLWSVRRVDRDLLQGDDKFAVAPPTAMSPYSEHGGGEELGALDAGEVGTSISGTSSIENTYIVDGINTTSVTSGSQRDSAGTGPAGRVHGFVVDKKTSEKLPGVTVIATGDGSQAQTAITDENGEFTIADIKPGSTLLTYYYADVTVQNNVKVAAASSVETTQRLDSSSGAKGEVIEVRASAPMIDQSSTAQGTTITHPGRSFQGELGDQGATTAVHHEDAAPVPTVEQGDAKIRAMAQKLAGTPKDVVIETAADADSKNRAAAVRNKLIDDGVPAKRIHVVAKAGESGLRVLAIAPGDIAETAAPAAQRGPTSDAPVGETHFIAEKPMDVKAGTSAMVSMVHSETDGGVVYLYDPVSDRGDKRFAFKAVKLDNPTGDTLESGPMTVYGDGRFVGEGITEPIAPHASVVVPFASDRQIMISQHGDDEERIAKLVTVQRGILTAEVQQRRVTHFTLSSRLDQPAKVFLRHRLESGWTLVDAPPKSMKVGDSTLFEVDVPAKETAEVVISESAPMERTLELTSESALDLMKVYLEDPDATPAIKSQLKTVLATHRAAADLVDKIATMREQLDEYRSRSGELHAQLVTLKAVRTGGDLMTGLRAKLLETSEKVQKLTIGIVDAEEKLMLTRVKFGNQLSDLHLTDVAVSKR